MVIKTWIKLIAFFVFTCTVVQAGELYTTVFNVLESKSSKKLLVLSGTDGRIYKIDNNKSNEKLLESLLGQVVKISFVENHKEALITSIRFVQPNEIDTRIYDLNRFQYNELRRFAPTDLQPYDMENIFRNLLNDGDRSRSQCFKRAHIWAYDMWSKLGIQSQKIFIFYTKRYSILEDFEWWFHVAPMVVSEDEEYVMDGTFFNKPVKVQEWKDRFLSKKITCPVIDDYKLYEKNHWTRLCFLMKVPMYYFSPFDIEQRDAQGIQRNHWVLEELQDARRAFNEFNSIYEGLDTGKPTITH